MRRVLPALLTLVLASASSPAHGKPEAPSVTDDARARDLFKQGDAAYAEGRYEDALNAFEEAHRLSKRPRLLFNIGNALERLGKLAEAADALEKYLPHAKPAERDVLAKRIQNLRKRATPLAKVELEEEEEAAPPPARREPEPAPERKAAVTHRQPEQDASSGESTLGYVLVGAGGVAVGAGAVFGLMALSARKDVEAACKESAGQTLCDASAEGAMARDQRYSLFADLGMGLGLLAVGAGVYFLVSAPSDAPPKRSQARFGTDFALHPSGGTIRVRGEF